MAEHIRAIDVSAFQGELDDQGWWDAVAREGVALLIAQGHGGLPGHHVGVNPHVRTHLKRAKAAGMQLALYSWPGRKWRAAVDAAGEFAEDLLFIGLDVESAEGIEAETVADVRDAGRKPVVYTGQGAWGATMHTSSAFSDEWLWDARFRFHQEPFEDCAWPGDGELASSFVSYGGWTSRIGWQVMGNVTFRGVTVDLSIIDGGWLASIQRRGGRVMDDDAALLDWLREHRDALDAVAEMVANASIEHPVPGSTGEDPRSRAIRRGSRLLEAFAAPTSDVEPASLKALVADLSQSSVVAGVEPLVEP